MKILILTKELPYPANTVRKIRTYNYIKNMVKDNQVSILSRYDRSYDNTEAVNHFTELGCATIFCNESVKEPSVLKKIKDLFLSLFSPYPYSVNSCISERMLERFLKTYRLGKFDIIVCDGIHETIHVPNDIYCYKILHEHAISLPSIQDVMKKKTNIFKKLFTFMEWKKFTMLENRMWKIYDEIHLYNEESKKIIEERVSHKKVKVIEDS